MHATALKTARIVLRNYRNTYVLWKGNWGATAGELWAHYTGTVGKPLGKPYVGETVQGKVAGTFGKLLGNTGETGWKLVGCCKETARKL